MKPKAPVRMKAHCQPKLRAIQGTTAGAMIAPTLVPALKRPVAKARSFFGNHSATDLIAAGKLAASPRPSAKRAAPKPKRRPRQRVGHGGQAPEDERRRVAELGADPVEETAGDAAGPSA